MKMRSQKDLRSMKNGKGDQLEKRVNQIVLRYKLGTQSD